MTTRDHPNEAPPNPPDAPIEDLLSEVLGLVDEQVKARLTNEELARMRDQLDGGNRTLVAPDRVDTTASLSMNVIRGPEKDDPPDLLDTFLTTMLQRATVGPATAQILANARAEADELRKGAEADAERFRDTALSLAGEIVASARAEADELVAAARLEAEKIRASASNSTSSSNDMPFDLNDTISATWRRRLAGPDGGRVHWRTKTTYYEAVARLLRTRPECTPNWRDVVEAASPRGSRSTFYEVTGPRSKHPLIDGFIEACQTASLQLALAFRRANAVDQLIDETKVWSYWPFREGWVSACYASPDLTIDRAADAMVAVLAAWARREPTLAAALDHTPPACAVEDLIRVHRGPLPAIRAVEILRQSMLFAARPDNDPMEQRMAAIADLRRSPDHRSRPDEIVLLLAENLYALDRETERMAPAQARSFRTTTTMLIADAGWRAPVLSDAPYEHGAVVLDEHV